MDGNTTIFEIRAATCRIDDRSAFLDALQRVSGQFGTHIICFNADMLAGKRHAEAAVCHAIRSFCCGEGISNTLEMEALLYAAGSRQCNVGATFGIREGEINLWICCYPASVAVWTALAPICKFLNDDSWDRIDDKKMEILMDLFRISETELRTLESPEMIIDLVLERVALLNVLR